MIKRGINEMGPVFPVLLTYLSIAPECQFLPGLLYHSVLYLLLDLYCLKIMSSLNIIF